MENYVTTGAQEPSSAPPVAKTVMEGPLLRQGAMGMWKQRYFSLDEHGKLRQTAAKPSASRAAGPELVFKAVFAHSLHDGRPNRFNVIVSNSDAAVKVAAPDRASRQAWISAISSQGGSAFSGVGEGSAEDDDGGDSGGDGGGGDGDGGGGGGGGGGDGGGDAGTAVPAPAAPAPAAPDAAVLLRPRVTSVSAPRAAAAAAQAAAAASTRARIKTMSLKEMKAYLEAEGVDHRGCLEKSDLRELALKTASPPLRVLVVGGGPAGLAAAVALTQEGHDVTIYEQRRQGDGGFGWLLMPNGVASLHTMRSAELLGNCFALEEAQLWDAESADVSHIAMDACYSASREAIVNGLLKNIPAGNVQTGYRLEAALFDARKQRMGELRFSHGGGGGGGRSHDAGGSSGQEAAEEATHPEATHPEATHLDCAGIDLVVGADGVNSHIAATCAPGGVLPGRHRMKRVNTLVTVHALPVLAASIRGKFIKTMFHKAAAAGGGGAQRCALGILSPSEGMVLGFLQFDTVVHGECPRSVPERHAFAMAALRLPARGAAAAANIPDAAFDFFEGGASFSDAACHLWRPRDVATPDGQPTHAGNVVLVGDACHPMSDFTSQGVSAALEDAVSLAVALRSVKSSPLARPAAISAALDAYAAERLPKLRNYYAAGEAISDNFCAHEGAIRSDVRPWTRTGSTHPRLAKQQKQQQQQQQQQQPPRPLRVVKRGSIASSKATGRKQRMSHVPAHSSSSMAYADTEGEGGYFGHSSIDVELLQERAFNFRWAALPPGVLPLTAASTDFKTAPVIREAVAKYMEGGYCNYGPNEGLPTFRAALADFVSGKLAKAHAAAAAGNPHAAGLEGGGGATSVTAEQVMAVNSAAAGVYHVAARVLANVGDEALVMTPVDFLLAKSVEALPGRVMRRYAVKKRLAAGGGGGGGEEEQEAAPTFDLAELEALVTPRTKLLSICNPHNPLGIAWTAAELIALADFAERHDLAIFSDEVWGDIVYAPRVHVPMASVSAAAARRTYTVLGFSKNFGLEGLRVGGLVAPSAADLVAVVETSGTSTTAGGTATLSQVAATAAMRGGAAWLAQWVLHLQGNMKYAVERLNAMPGIAHVRLPSACFIIFADVSALLVDNTLAEGDESEEEDDGEDESKRVREPEAVSVAAAAAAAAAVVVEGALKAGSARAASPGDGGSEAAAASDTDKKAEAEAEKGGGGGAYYAVPAMYRHLFTSEQIARYTAEFKAIDTDGGGTLSPAELRTLVDTLGSEAAAPITDEQLGEMLAEVDINGDGELDFGEFLAMMLGIKHSTAAGSRLGSLIVKAGAAGLLGSGMVSKADLAAEKDIEMELMEWLIEHHQVAIIPGCPMFFGPSGASGHIRIAVGTSKRILAEAMDRLEVGLAAWPLRSQDGGAAPPATTAQRKVTRRSSAAILVERQSTVH